MTDRDSVLSALDAVTASIDGAEHRAGQREMAELVATAIARRRHLVVQAGTGTGKTLAYVVPAVMSGVTTVVATATKALQDQLATKDLPLVAATLDSIRPEPMRWAVLKGRSNYLCRQRLDEHTAGDQATIHGVDTSADQIGRISAWADTTDSGDLADLDWNVDAAVRDAVTVGPDECPGAHRCPRGDDCFAERARDRAAGAEVIVVNTHLYGLDIAADGQILPDHELVVFDEAHVVEDIMSDTVGIQLAPGRFVAVAAAVRAVIADNALDRGLLSVVADLSAVLDSTPSERLSTPLPDHISEVLATARGTLTRAGEAIDQIRSDDVGVQQKRLRAQVMLLRSIDMIDIALTAGENRVAFIAGAPGARRLEIAPLDVGPTLRTGVWERRTAVLTSATVPANLTTRIGLTATVLGDNDTSTRVDAADVGSPFDYGEQALLYCAMHLPPPNADNFRSASHNEMADLITAAGGRTLALFTSWAAMDAAADALRDRIEVPLLTQRDLPKAALLRRFADDEGTTLLATAGLFQGVDVPGRTLSLVIIDRIPFPRPDDPLLGARRDLLGPSAFREIDLPRAATMLAQATGRLIRSADDRGVVAVLDRRLGAAKYRWDIISALPPMRRTRDPDEVLATLANISSSA